MNPIESENMPEDPEVRLCSCGALLGEPEVSRFLDREIRLWPRFCETCIALHESRADDLSRGLVVHGTDKERPRKWEWVCRDAFFLQAFQMDLLPAFSQGVARSVFGWEKGSVGIGLIGPTGAGKSVMLYELLRRWYVDEGLTVMLLPMTEFGLVCSALDGVGRLKMIGRAIDADLLLLDDLGTEKPTARVETDLSTVLDARYRARKPLFVTTNFTGEALVSRMSRENGPPILRRVKEGCRFVTVAPAGRNVEGTKEPNTE